MRLAPVASWGFPHPYRHKGYRLWLKLRSDNSTRHS